jgi:hypothetical protein
MSRNPLLIATKGVASVVGGSSFAPETPVVLFLRISLQTEKKKMAITWMLSQVQTGQ